jgi:phosphate transport system substrate-binding protein
MRNRVLVFGFTILLFLTQNGCHSHKVTMQATDRYDSGTIHISCDESFKPVIDAEIQVYHIAYPKANIIVHYKPEADCLRDFAVDSIRMVIATRSYTKSEELLMGDSLHINPDYGTLAFDAIAVVVNPKNKDSLFSMKEIRELLTGKSKTNLLPVLDGVKATSTVRYMVDSVLHGGNLGKNVVAATSSNGVLDYVAKTPNAVGFVGVSWAENTEDTTETKFIDKVRIARLESTDSINGYVLPVQIFIYRRSYPMIRTLFYVLKENYAGLGHGFANFMGQDRGQLIFRRSNLFPAQRQFYIRDAELQQD